MFTVLALLIGYSLLTFGAVLPNSWFVLSILWLASIAGCFVGETFQRRKLSTAVLILFALGVLLFQFARPKLAVGLIAAVWAWRAAANHEVRTLRFFHVLLFLGLFEALLGLAQFFIIPGWIFGYINILSTRSTGTLINHNHFAGLLEMLIPVSVGFAYIGARRYREMARPYVYVLAGAFMGLALLFSISRMGIFSFLATILFMGFLLRLRDSKRRLATGLGLSLFGLVAAGALWIGIDVIVERYAALLEEDGVLREGRTLVFRDTIRMIAANPLGVGSLNYQYFFRQHQTFHPELLIDHAHNDYLETTAEWGIPVALAFWGFVVFVLVRAVRAFLTPGLSLERRGILLACSGAIFSILLHSLTDFNLQIPSNAMIFFTFVGISIAMALQEKEPQLTRITQI